MRVGIIQYRAELLNAFTADAEAAVDTRQFTFMQVNMLSLRDFVGVRMAPDSRLDEPVLGLKVLNQDYET